MQITMDTRVSEAFKMSKNVKNVFSKYNLLCSECKGVSQDRIRNVIRNNGLSAEKFLSELNENL